MTPAPAGFDLDMTLIDSWRAIMASFAGALHAAGRAADHVHGLEAAGAGVVLESLAEFPAIYADLHNPRP